tara:strand:- start:13986 stop:14453 length:468 start_codon:yes stop_codon:yes gene_type:complete
MALIIYPTASYDSFITIADANTAVDSLTLYSTQWAAKSDTEKEIYLRIAFRNIDDHVNQTLTPYADPIATCVGEAQALMAIQDVVYGTSTPDTDLNGAIKKQKVASLEIEYYDVSSGKVISVPIVPPMAVPCLETLGYIFSVSVGNLSQLTLGRS